MKRSLAALALVLAAGCMATTAHTRGQQTTYARPEPDPASHGILSLSQGLPDGGLERVVAKLGVTGDGQLVLLDLLTPDLTDADNLEIRRALEGCAWKPAIGPDGARVAGTLTLAVQR
jgi:hypothetical protein